MKSSVLRISVIILSSTFQLALGGSAVFAQQSEATNPPQTIQQRKQNQQDRIANGIRSGQMTPGEAARSERQQQGLNREVSGMRRANGGKLTRGERALVNRQQNHTSRQIYNRKHNGRRGY